jgi:pimeloyl-ACP methyl ester carboxylesterase
MPQCGMPTDLHHRTVDLAGVRIHLVEQGEGPVVLLVHGFPESWYSWRHQLPAIAAAGYRVVAIDVRGYGRSSAPHEVSEYGILSHVADNLGVVAALGVDHAIVIGHDWGSPIAAASALLRPDVFRAVALLSVPYNPPGGRRPTETFARMGGEEEFYINYFQAPGRAETEIESDVRSWLAGFYVAASGDAIAAPDGGTMASIPPGGQLRDRLLVPEKLPAWLSDDDLDFYVGEFERTGFRGPLNRYRNVDRDWVDLRPWNGRPITVPSLFIGGQYDGPTRWGQAAIGRYRDTLPGLVESHILDGCGHWVQQERPEEVNRLLTGWLGVIDPAHDGLAAT